MTAKPAVTLEHVTKVYRTGEKTVRALEDISIEVPRGEFVAVCGPSGSGKSTLLLVLGGMSHPTSGTVRLGELDLYAARGPERARCRAERIGFVFQMFHLVPYLNVIENVLLPGGAVKGRTGLRERARELLERFGMADRLLHKPSELSVGERQRTALARALLHRPELVLADEPTGNLDPVNAAEVIHRLAEYCREGGTVLMVTHDPVAAEQANRVLYLDQGRLRSNPPAAPEGKVS